MARKSKRFGSSSAVHRQKARLTAESFRSTIKMLRINLEGGECHRAFSRLKMLYTDKGEFIADRRATSRVSFPRTGSMTKQLDREAQRFATLCLVK